MVIERDYYAGFEGEPEMKFVRARGDETIESVRLWGGYFDAIMGEAKPDPVRGWEGLALPHNLDQGWNEESPWTIQDVPAATTHWRRIDVRSLDEKTKEVFHAISDLLFRAQAAGETVRIFRD